MILSFTWLKKHNPEISFQPVPSIKMSRCLPQCCTGCWTELKEEHNAKKDDACQTGLLLAFIEDINEDEEEAEANFGPKADNLPDEQLKEGDQIWVTGLLPEPEYICASSTISQCLVEAFKWNSEPPDYKKHIPPHLHDFHSVFSKESFNNLPESKPWDHAVELIPDATLKSCKVHLLAASEQKELDTFLKEKLNLGQI